MSSFEIGIYASNVEVFSLPTTMFPILVWEKEADKFTLIDRYRTFQDTFDFKYTLLA